MNLAVLSEDARLLRMCKRLGDRFHLNVVAGMAVPLTYPDITVADAGQLDRLRPGVTVAVIDLKSETFPCTLLSSPNVIPLPAPAEEAAMGAALRVAIRLAAAAPEVQSESALRNLMRIVADLSDHGAASGKTVAMAVHDSRTLLTGALGYCRMILRSGGPLDYGQVQSLEHLQGCLDRLNRSCADLLELALDRSGQLVTRKQKGDLAATLKRSILPLLPLASDKNLLLRLNMQDPPGEVHFQPDQMERVLANLVENACKFTPRGGVVEVSGSPAHDPKLPDSSPKFRTSTHFPNAYRIDVRDSGPGVPQHQLEEIFDEQFIGSQPDGHHGFGLGLAISRAIVQAHEGRIWAESDEHGLTVSFVLSMRKRTASRRGPVRVGASRPATKSSRLAS